MQSMQITKEENSPFIQFLLLAIFSVLCVLFFLAISFVLCYFIYGVEIIKDTSWISGDSTKYIGAFKIMLTFQQIGFFLAPALLLSLTENSKLSNFYNLKTPQANGLFLVSLIMVVSMPIMGLVNEWNQQMSLPSFFKELEVWMKNLEDQGAKTTEAILKMTSWTTFFINIFVISFVPAICEEFMFRGAIQRTFLRVFKNPHVSIWLAAFIFSCIHFQFFGFFPRLILGAAFGYIYYWTGSIWYSVWAHFLNNGFAVSVAWYLQKNNLPLSKADETNFAWYGYLISAILTLALFKFFKDQNSNQNES
jgi:membrane protease YdiL (CAAX protease family)